MYVLRVVNYDGEIVVIVLTVLRRQKSYSIKAKKIMHCHNILHVGMNTLDIELDMAHKSKSYKAQKQRVKCPLYPKTPWGFVTSETESKTSLKPEDL